MSTRSGPAGTFLQPLAPTLFRGGGASINDDGSIGDNYTAGPNYRACINSATAQARRVTAAPYNARYDLLVSDLCGAGSSQPVSLDGGTSQSVDNYASSRNASGVVWSSPILTFGAHTITIVNTGQRNSGSSGIKIAIDRADVFS